MACNHVCSFFKYGHCRYKDRCRNEHIHELCKNKECSVKSCRLRHPKTCLFFSALKRCKFGANCNFKHEVHENQTHMEVSLILADIKKLEEDVALIRKENLELKVKLEALNSTSPEIDKSSTNRVSETEPLVAISRDDEYIAKSASFANILDQDHEQGETTEVWKKKMELCGTNLTYFPEWSYKTP